MDKKRLRLETNDKLNALDGEYISSSDLKIFESLTSLPELHRARRVFLYHSVAREVDTIRLMRFCDEHAIPYALPRTRRGGQMDFCLVKCKEELVLRPPFNIPEPPETADAVLPEKDDVIIVPGLCFDEKLFRLGHGGGYYDRYLSGSGAYSIGLCREELVLPRIPTQTHDVPVDCLVTEKKVRNR